MAELVQRRQGVQQELRCQKHNLRYLAKKGCPDCHRDAAAVRERKGKKP